MLVFSAAASVCCRRGWFTHHSEAEKSELVEKSEKIKFPSKREDPVLAQTLPASCQHWLPAGEQQQCELQHVFASTF